MTAWPLRDERRVDPRRRALLVIAAGAVLHGAGCASAPAPLFDWEARLTGGTWALLGEVHDNPEQHRLRSAVFGRALQRGWRPALVMEQFDLDRQDDIDRARRERPRDAAHLIARAGAAHGWHWPYYEPVIALALAHDLPLVAGNVPRTLTARLVRESYAAVLGPERATAWGLDVPPDDAWQTAQEREIDSGHCHALPRELWPGLARGQFARDAAMAHLLQRHAAPGALLWAGNGHVRRDLGVPRWLQRRPAPAVFAVGFVENDTPPQNAGVFDAVVMTVRAERGDPCEAFRARPLPGGPTPGSQRT